MALSYVGDLAVFAETVGVEEAEGFLSWLQQHPKASADFAACTHLHAAELQVLMAARTPVAAWPQNAELKQWLQAALGTPVVGRA